MKTVEQIELEQQMKKDIKQSKCYRDLVYGILGNFSTEELIDHILTNRLTKESLISKIVDL